MGLESQANNKLQSAFGYSAGRTDAWFPIRIETPRLILREHEPADVDRILEISRAPDFVYYCFDGTHEKAESFIAEALRTQKANPATGMRDNHMLAVVLKETGEIIGHASVERVHYIPGIDYEPNYFIDPAYQKKGYGPEALCNMIHFAFTALGQTAMTSTQHPDNTNAIGLAEKLYGFRNAGEVQIDTARGKEPRLLSKTTAEDFYALRALDRHPMFLTPLASAAPANKPT